MMSSADTTPRTLVRLCIAGYQGWSNTAQHRAAYGRMVKRVCGERGWSVDALLSTDSSGGLDAITAHWSGELRKQHIEIACSRHHRHDAELRQVDNLACLCDAALVLVKEGEEEATPLIAALRRHNKPHTIACADTGALTHHFAR